ncbi:unnamed protein product [Lepeophtheirus salmonis]|uniref:(salmon louse) hypothetical protein n=1 Tax=Lepeophtheirus salmonis TaxID=72036 RepID=A0A7R8HCX5_LEPSM|nr:unnamed protein product [Lepeophtheirus salmonis]CAF2999780.1 unnamed protein product [Lepeophtheirus salmonis]
MEKDRPVAYASHKLSCAEKNYSQIDREDTGIICGLECFERYFLGRTLSIKQTTRFSTLLLPLRKTFVLWPRLTPIFKAYGFYVWCKSYKSCGHIKTRQINQLPPLPMVDEV